jgi:hypothetical protein
MANSGASRRTVLGEEMDVCSALCHIRSSSEAQPFITAVHIKTPENFSP